MGRAGVRHKGLLGVGLARLRLELWWCRNAMLQLAYPLLT